jgi:hypothetical protein
MKECLAEEVQKDWIFYVTVGWKPEQGNFHSSKSELSEPSGNESG